MINSIKDLLKINEEIKKISGMLEDNSSEMGKFSKEISNLRQEIDSLRSSQSHLAEKIKTDINLFQEYREELKKEINDFKIVKSRMENRLVEKFEEDIRAEIIPRFERMELHVRNFETLGEKMNKISEKCSIVGDEIDKFRQISTEIKQGDFELSHYAKEIRNMDNEKLQLLKKIDTLERLVSKMRRSR